MRYKDILILGVLFVMASCHYRSRYVEIPDNIENVKSSEYKQVPDSKILIIPPPDFFVKINIESSIGYENMDSTAFIHAMVFPFNFNSLCIKSGKFTREWFVSKKAQIKEYKQFKINGFSGIYANVQFEPDKNRQYLIFGDSTMVVGLYGGCPADDVKVNDQIKDAMLSMVYDKNIKN